LSIDTLDVFQEVLAAAVKEMEEARKKKVLDNAKLHQKKANSLNNNTLSSRRAY